MGRQIVTACMFCFLCATHAHCASHHESHESHQIMPLAGVFFNDGGGGVVSFGSARSTREIAANKGSPEDYVKHVFEEFGDGEKLTRIGFESFLRSLNPVFDGTSLVKPDSGVDKNGSKNAIVKCSSLFSELKENSLSKSDYKEICPKILYQIFRGCNPINDESTHHHEELEGENDKTSVSAAWVYATVSVILISLCGLLAVAVIPLMQKSIYHGLLQFLVALAVGTLCGDALLHLLPHAMMSMHSDHDHSHGHALETSLDHDSQHETNLLRGLVAALSVVFFYFTEKCLSLITDWKKKHQRKNTVNTRVRVMRDDNGGNEESRVGEKLCKHKYSSYPYCYGEISNSADGHQATADSEINNISKIREENGPNKTQEEGELINKEEIPNSEKQLLESSADPQNDYTTIILREHETRHHGHAHTHGHVHSPPGSMGSVAWMVVMGDGIHNLTDGLAIGAAFAANIGGGVSTAVAVFCHELPHEIGDFAVLLKAGMSAKQAVFYNMLSSLLCFVGMSIGVILGHNDSLKLWVFSGAAGMFLYIALVDMIPELTSSHSKEGGSVCQCLLQLFGLLTGIGIMLIIALYEHSLMNAFQNSF